MLNPIWISTDNLWIILRHAMTQHKSFNASEFKIRWTNYKQKTYFIYNAMLNPLVKYLFRFQNIADNT